MPSLRHCPAVEVVSYNNQGHCPGSVLGTKTGIKTARRTRPQVLFKTAAEGGDVCICAEKVELGREAETLTVVVSGGGMLAVAFVLYPFPCFLSVLHAQALIF